MKPLLVVIAGPTGIGKTTCAIQLADALKTEIISADSRQIFKELSIGTAVPSEQELKQIKHYFIQSNSIEESYNASKYELAAIQKLRELYNKYPLVILVGGSGLYIDAVCNGIDETPDIPSNTREKYKSIFEKEGLAKLQELLKKCDVEYYNKVDLNNYSRLLKALEIFEITGKPYSSFLKRKAKERDFNTLKIILDINRETLYKRINERVEKMVKMGLEEEARKVYPKRELTPLNTVGYKEWFEFFDGKISKEDAITQIKNHTRAYARKQLTWFRRYTDAYWFRPDKTNDMISLINKSLAENANK